LKILIFLLAVLFGVWLWRRNRLNALKEKNQENGKPPASSGARTGTGTTNPTDAVQGPSTMHPCNYCGVHSPESDMVAGLSGRYCSDAHRQAAGDQAP
jgi:uncharacterized protein